MVFEQSACCKKRGVCTNKKYITYFIQMCVSYIFTKIYMHIHTHVFSNLSGGFGWGLGHCSTNFRWYIYYEWKRLKLGLDWMLTNFWCFTDDLSICACLQTHGARVFENHRQLHILDEYWLSTKVVLDQFWTSFFRSPLFGSALFQGHFCRKKYGFPNLWSNWGELPILIR